MFTRTDRRFHMFGLTDGQDRRLTNRTDNELNILQTDRLIFCVLTLDSEQTLNRLERTTEQTGELLTSTDRQAWKL